MIAPRFAKEDWYWDPSDPRCPHDAWLNSLQVFEPATGERSEERQTSILVELFGAYHDGVIRLRYTGVKRYTFSSGEVAKGVGDWISNDFSRGSEDTWIHRVIWARGLWHIEAREIDYEWIAKNA